MDAIGSTTPLADLAATAGRPVRKLDDAPVRGESLPGPRPMSADSFSMQYAMTVLAKITHAGADQALTLIQTMLPPR